MIQRFGAGARASRAVAYGNVFETGGIVARDMSGDITEQTRQVLQELEELLAEADVSRDQLTRIQIWLSDIANFDSMNAVYDNWVASAAKPTRATVESKLADPGYLIEIQAFAWRG